MYNEEENVGHVLKKTDTVMKGYGDYEIICVNDGSGDGTLEALEGASKDYPALRIVSYKQNRGMGYALRQGFEHAKGDVMITLDADMTFDPADIPKLMEKIDDYDMVIGSPYIKGGGLEGVPWYREVISKLGNFVLTRSMPYNVKSTTTVFRAYRRELIDAIDIESDRMEINPEILAKAGSLGYRVMEVPVKLSTRIYGESKFNFISGAKGHFWLSAYEKPFIIFGFFGFLLMVIGAISGIYILNLFFKNELDPNRPLINMTVLLIVSGLLVLLFGFVSNQILQIKREILKMRRDISRLKQKEL
jgi:glycosyltransferase involved in cell wall biosynthesis